MSDHDILIKKNASIGAIDAYADSEFLFDCFIDSGWIDELRDCENHRSIVLGRTGSGKSALLLQLQHTQNNVIRLDPTDFAFRFIENSTVIKFFETAGVNLDLFYRLLWRHVLVVELLRRRYQLRHESDSIGFLATLNDLVKRDSGRRAALDYLRSWGESFWETTEARTRELTTKFESALTSSAGVDIDVAKLGAEGALKLGAETKEQIAIRGNDVVNSIQIRELRDVVKLLSEKIFIDEKSKYYVVVDQLDEEWVASEARFRLVRALIEEVRAFREIRNVKIIIALREDLLAEVIDFTRRAGFQEEKYQDYYLRLTWSKEGLSNLIEKRLSTLFRRQYTNANVVFSDIFPSAKKKQKVALTYILERTLLRPRDVIAFVNECLHVASERQRVSWKALKAAEASYSKQRVNSLVEEWLSYYPSIAFTVDLLRDLPTRFQRSDISGERFEKTVESMACSDKGDACIDIARKLFEAGQTVSKGDLVDEILRSFYRAGLIGAKFNAIEPTSWVSYHEKDLSRRDARRAINFQVHKMFWRGLGIRILPEDDDSLDVEDE